ncbi:MAG: YhcH/YjgK/YiaL family protein [Sedimentisphaerales bacterium]|nr:YhcH/YjgK/YiaL family protein [Sedimentisphaerales bacterium]
MIVDKIENAHIYNAISTGLTKALEILKDPALGEQEKGRYEVDGENVFYMVQQYTTKPVEQSKLEAHKTYIDVHYIVKGNELVGYTSLDNPKLPAAHYDKGDDRLYDVPDNISRIILTPGTFCVAFPQDAHMPCCQIKGPEEVKKIVVKVKMEAKTVGSK